MNPRITSIILFLTIYINVYSQVSNKVCDSIKSNPISFFTFNDIECEYLKDLKKLRIFESCYKKSDNFNKAVKNFTIPEYMMKEDASLVFLIINSESMNDGERQYWLDLTKTMNLEQVERLRQILLKERIRFAEIDRKYGVKSEKSKEEKYLLFLKGKNKKKINTTNILLLGIEKDRVHFAQPISKTKLLDFYYQDTISMDNFDLINPNKEDSYRVGEKSYYNTSISKYKKVFLLKDDIISTYYKYFPEYITEWYKNMIYDYGINQKLSDSELLKLLKIKNLFINNKDSIKIDKAITFAKHQYSLHSIKDFTNACKILNYRIDKNYATFKDFWRISSTLAEFPMYEYYTNSNYIELVHTFETKYDSIKQNVKPNKLYTDFILLDFTSSFSNDSKIKKIADEFKSSLTNDFTNNKNNFKNEWYYILTKNYIDGSFKNYLSYEDIRGKVISLKQETKNNSNLNAMLSEYLMSYLIYQMIYVKDFDENNIKQLIVSLNQIFNDRNSKYFFYIQNYFSFFLNDKIEEIIKLRNHSIKKYALVIGISNYKNLQEIESTKFTELSDLRFASKDAIDFKKLLDDGDFIDNDWEIKTLTDSDATSEPVHIEINNLFNNAKKNDIILLYFSGHAKLDNQKELYLLTYDYRDDLMYKNISDTWLKKRYENTFCKNVFIFVDACNTGTIVGKGDELPSSFLYKEIKKLDGYKLFFTSSSPLQQSYEHDLLKNSIFTYFLIKGLKGNAPDNNNDGKINTSELINYVIREVENFSSNHFSFRQRPDVRYPLNMKNFPISIRKQ